MRILKKILLIAVSLIAAAALLIGVLVAVFAPGNVEAMNRSVDTALAAIGEHYDLEPVDCGDYSQVTVYGIMKFNVRQYAVAGIGNLSVMTVNMGLMQMATVVLTPVERDIPLISMDYMYMLGNRTCYLEFYDLVLDQGEPYAALLEELGSIRQEYDSLENVTPSSAWYDSLKTEGIYKKGPKDADPQFEEILEKGIGAVLDYSETLPVLDPESRTLKAALQKQYSDGLIENGGISTDAFVKSLGAEATRDFFDRVLFHTT